MLTEMVRITGTRCIGRPESGIDVPQIETSESRDERKGIAGSL
jgi:hypothetical protein